MHRSWRNRLAAALRIALSLVIATSGCAYRGFKDPGQQAVFSNLPRELSMVTQPPITIAPPDIILLEAVRTIPKPPYRIAPLDDLLIQASDVLPTAPINAIYVVEPEGTVNLGREYGSVRIAGLTLDQARSTIESYLKKRDLVMAKVDVSLSQSRALQQISGEHLVRPDGTIALGTYGSVYVAGMTLEQAKLSIEQHLSQFMLDPEVSIDVLAYNSKVFYVIFDGGGQGESVARLPITGNETVLDAMSSLGGVPAIASKQKIWVARPGPADMGCDQILPVDWKAIAMGGDTATNYQLLPGDRLYVKADQFITANNLITTITAPVERIAGFMLLGSGVVQNFKFGFTGTGQGGLFGGFGGFGGFPGTGF